mmetsp:Transcript_33750/g.76415  ORF Transcript_33750/g.76415 Transcript_33750/m.76415 type:complete len:339 (-) Transcript_33750:412-1428(-)
MSVRLRLRGPEGQAVGSFDGSMTIEAFVSAAASQLGCTGEFQLLVGHPPKAIAVSSEPLSSAVQSGDTVILNRVAAAPAPPPPQPYPDSSPPTSAGTSWACEACTLENELSTRTCIVCGTPRPGGGGGGGGGGSGGVGGVGGGGAGGAAELVRMADDNSCLFHAVGYLFSHTAKPHELRAQIVSAVRADPVKWSDATLGKPVEEYVAFISDSRRWGGQVELAIFSELFRAEISVTDIQTGRNDVYGQGEGYIMRGHILFSGIHFDAVSCDGQRTLPVGEAYLFEPALAALAAERRAAGGFTDQTTMRLRCKACGHIMVGDYEARLHAGTSGHKDFVQA